MTHTIYFGGGQSRAYFRTWRAASRFILACVNNGFDVQVLVFPR